MKQHTDQAVAKYFDKQAFLANEIGDRLLQHLEPMTLSPAIIVDLGCAAGGYTRLLSKRYRSAKLLGVDLNEQMIQRARKQKPWFSKQRYVQTRFDDLPVEDKSVDLVFSNLALLTWDDMTALFREVHRVLVPNGVFLFSTLGPGCLQEAHPRLVDMHNVGDLLVKMNLVDPVMESETITFVYDKMESLKEELQLNRLDFMSDQQLETALEQKENELVLNLEVIYGHAWGTDIPAGTVSATDGVAEVPLTAIRYQLKSS